MTDASPAAADQIRALVDQARAAARDAPAAARIHAATEVADAVGCMAVGASHPLVRRVAGAGARPWREGRFTSFASAEPVSLEQAVVLDSLACHVDEFDSLHPASAVVASAAVIPAALQVAAWRESGGHELIDAVLAGYAVVTRLGARWGGPAMYSRGWWPTSSFAAAGAAVATGVLLGLDDDRLGNALAIAVAGSGGLLSDDLFGEAHYLSAAEASARGVRAAFFATADARASWSYLDGPAVRAFGPPVEETAGASSEAPWQAVTSSVIKLYPCSRPLQGFAQALTRLGEEGMDLNEVRDVQLLLPEPLLRFVSSRREVDGPTEAAASASFVYAAVRDGQGSDPLFFRQATLAGRATVPTVTLAPDPDAEPGSWSGDLSLVDGSGRRHTLRAATTETVSADVVAAKLAANLRAAGSTPDRAARTVAALFALDSAPSVTDLRLHSLPQPTG